jgi:hypothetical protein
MTSGNANATHLRTRARRSTSSNAGTAPRRRCSGYTYVIPDSEQWRAAVPTGFSGAIGTLGIAGNSKMPMSGRSGKEQVVRNALRYKIGWKDRSPGSQ